MTSSIGQRNLKPQQSRLEVAGPEDTELGILAWMEWASHSGAHCGARYLDRLYSEEAALDTPSPWYCWATILSISRIKIPAVPECGKRLLSQISRVDRR